MKHTGDATVAVLGLGLIGSIWAANYQKDGVLRASWNRSPKPGLNLSQNSLEACAAKAEILHVCLFDAPSVHQVLDQLEPHLGERHLLIQSSTVDPESASQLESRVQKTGARYLEAPFTGSKIAAEGRQTVFFLGGQPATIREADPVLARISRKRYTIGSPAQAASLKLAMNLQIAVQMQGICEAIRMSRLAGLPDSIFFEVFRENVAWSSLAELKEPKLREGDYAPQFSIRNMHKDICLAELAGRDLPALAMVRRCLEHAMAAGHGEDDFVALIRLLESQK